MDILRLWHALCRLFRKPIVALHKERRNVSEMHLHISAVIDNATVTLKLTLPGLLSGVILTFIPSMGLFFIADILGGNKVVLVGSLIQDQLMKAHNWPFAAALSVVLMILTSLMISLYKRVTHTTELEGIL